VLPAATLDAAAAVAPEPSSAELPVPTACSWYELLLGRRSDPLTGHSWDAALLQATQAPVHNFLLLAWRHRAAVLGGVPTLQPAGRGIVVLPYKRIGVRPA